MGHPETEVSVLFMLRLCAKHLPVQIHKDVWVTLLVQSVADKVPLILFCLSLAKLLLAYPTAPELL